MIKRNYLMLFILLILSTGVALTSCGNDDAAADREPDIEAFEVRGRYLSTDMRGESISIVHETVPDIMNAMRMNFRIDDPSVAAGLEAGDVISFEMYRMPAGWYARVHFNKTETAGAACFTICNDLGGSNIAIFREKFEKLVFACLEAEIANINRRHIHQIFFKGYVTWQSKRNKSRELSQGKSTISIQRLMANWYKLRHQCRRFDSYYLYRSGKWDDPFYK
jgi:Cu/Ag efflux protein CusF